MRQVDGEIGALADDAEQRRLAVGSDDLMAGEEGGARRRPVSGDDQTLAPPYRDEAARRVGEALGEPCRILAEVPDAVQPAGGIKIGLFHRCADTGTSGGRGASGTPAGRIRLLPQNTAAGACGTVCQNSGSWPKKMRAPPRSMASSRSSEASIAARS